MNLPTEAHDLQAARWPAEGAHILAHHDEETIVVYQAYRPEIGLHAIERGRLDGPAYSLNRMSWIKPNFLWMMFRSGWGTKEGQEVVLGLRLRRNFFDGILRGAVASAFDARRHASHEAWRQAVEGSEVRLQWDPDHDPLGGKLARRAVQLGLRGQTLRAFAGDELLEVIDMRAFIAEQRELALARSPLLRTPLERVYLPAEG
ncbi:MAG: DUF4291 domain-containing protein [Aquabacterium sp.]|jgi:hypothetical protein|nr:MAG: DUF4291 domain-containing protein [Aquabacterium sp.]